MVFADCVILYSGETLEGVITAEDKDGLQIEVANKARTIFSTRTVPKFDIQWVERDTPEMKAEQRMLEEFAEAQKYKLQNSSYPQAYYDKIVNGVFQKFIVAYKGAPLSEVVSGRMHEWENEREKVASGAVKLDNRWYYGEEQARQLLAEATQAVDSNRYDRAIDVCRAVMRMGKIPADNLKQAAQMITNAYGDWEASLEETRKELGKGLQFQNDRISELNRSREMLSQDLSPKPPAYFPSPRDPNAGRYPTLPLRRGTQVIVQNSRQDPPPSPQAPGGQYGEALRQSLAQTDAEIRSAKAEVAQLNKETEATSSLLLKVKSGRMQAERELRTFLRALK
ncbi:MAG TPA: hypothetical protein VL486_15185 [Verrucomicrobiae bacterium]|nr:hypothetical protein [Verrucomicrobiae bacterium]